MPETRTKLYEVPDNKIEYFYTKDIIVGCSTHVEYVRPENFGRGIYKGGKQNFNFKYTFS